MEGKNSTKDTKPPKQVKNYYFSIKLFSKQILKTKTQRISKSESKYIERQLYNVLNKYIKT